MGTQDGKAKKGTPQMGRLFGAIVGVTALSALCVYYTPYDGTWFSLHPLLAVIAYVWCMSASIIFLKSHQQTPLNSFWSQTTYYAYLLHNLTSGLGFILGFFSFYVIYTNKDELEKPHFTSSHAWAGLIVFVLMEVNVALGVGGYYFPKFTKNILPVKPLKLHHQLGNAAWILGLITVALGFMSHRWSPAKDLSYVEQALLVLSLPGVFWLSKKLRIKPKKSPEQIAAKKKGAKTNVAVLPPSIMFIALQSETAAYIFESYIPMGDVLQVVISYGIIIRYAVMLYNARKNLK